MVSATTITEYGAIMAGLLEVSEIVLIETIGCDYLWDRWVFEKIYI